MNIDKMDKTDDGRSKLRLRKQSQEDEEFLLRLMPHKGEKLVAERLDELVFEFRVEPAAVQTTDDAVDATPTPYDSMTVEELKTLCAKRGITPERNARKFDIMQSLKDSDANNVLVPISNN